MCIKTTTKFAFLRNILVFPYLFSTPLVNMFSESAKKSPTARTNGRGCVAYATSLSGCVAYATSLNCSRSEGK